MTPESFGRRRPKRSGNQAARSVSAGEPLGFVLRTAVLHIHDLAIPESDDHGAALSRLSFITRHVRGPDDLVVTDFDERQIVDRPSAAPLQDLTGLVWPASRGRVLPPEAAGRDAAPLGVLREERDERLWIAAIESIGCDAKLLDHSRSMAQPGEEDESVRGAPAG